MENKEVYQKAKKRAETKIGFYVHLSIFIFVITLLIIVNLTTSAEYMWFKWPLMGWGIGVLIHGLRAFVFSANPTFLEKMIEKEMEKEL